MTPEMLLKNNLNKIKALNGNIYPLSVPERVPAPYVAYVQSGGEYIKTLDGYDTMSEISYEVNILADRYSTLKQLENEVVNVLKSLLGSDTDMGKIQDINIDAPVEKYEASIKLQRANIVFTIFL